MDLILLLACEFLITETGQSRAGGVCQQYLISVSLAAIAQITPKTQDCQSISNVQKQDRMSNSPCCVLKHRHIFLWKHNDDIIALEFSKIF